MREMNESQKDYFTSRMPKVTARLYEFLSASLSSSELLKLRDQEIIWISEELKFVDPRAVAFDVSGDLNLSPYVRPLPKQYKANTALHPFFHFVGVQEAVNSTHYRLILRNLAAEDGKLHKEHLSLVLGIVQYIARDKREKGESEIKNEEALFLPTEEGRLCDVSRVMYNDGSAENFSELGEGYSQIHPSISAADAELLGATPYSDILGDGTVVDQTVDTLGFIKNVLNDYPISDIFREFMQNSDDAKATQFHIFVDSRPAGAIASIDVLGQHCPAVYIFNDDVFSSEDFKRLLSPLTTNHKSADCIGYHVKGFNSCYGLTDTPIILSGSDLVVLDPSHTVWKKGGRKFDLRNKNVTRAYPGISTLFRDIKSILQPHGCQKSTIFRFPLRTATSMNVSAVSPGEIESLLTAFRQEAMYLMLLLRSIRSVRLTEWKPDTEAPTCTFELHMERKTFANQPPSLSLQQETFSSAASPLCSFMTAFSAKPAKGAKSKKFKELLGAVSFPVPLDMTPEGIEWCVVRLLTCLL